MSEIRNFPKKTLAVVCALRCLLALIALCAHIYTLIAKDNAPLTRAAIGIPISQLIIGAIGLFETSRTTSKASSWTLVFLSLVPLVGFFYPVTYLTPFYFYVEWGGSSTYALGSVFDKHIAAGQYILCIADTYLAVTTFSLLVAGLRKPVLARRGVIATSIPDKRSKPILVTGVLHLVMFFIVIIIQAVSSTVEWDSFKFHSYLGLFLCVNYFFIYAFVSSVIAFIYNGRYSIFHYYMANIATLLSTLTYFLISGFIMFSLSTHYVPEEVDTTGYWVYPASLFVVGSAEVAISSVGIHVARKLFKQINVITLAEDNEMKQLNS